MSSQLLGLHVVVTPLLNEFHSEGCITLAFPTLFPTGAVDFTAPRMRPVTLGYYLKHDGMQSLTTWL